MIILSRVSQHFTSRSDYWMMLHYFGHDNILRDVLALMPPIKVQRSDNRYRDQIRASFSTINLYFFLWIIFEIFYFMGCKDRLKSGFSHTLPDHCWNAITPSYLCTLSPELFKEYRSLQSFLVWKNSKRHNCFVGTFTIYTNWMKSRKNMGYWKRSSSSTVIVTNICLWHCVTT